uniref:Lebercilin-like protein n=1 Tax=Falco tinnunculus TaxID=100819 RepID=A0A8C4XQ77_FALTI
MAQCSHINAQRYEVFNGFICEILEHCSLSIDLGCFVKYTTNSSFLSLQSSMISQKKNIMAQQLSSERLHKIKELKNEIFVLQQKLEASSLENHILKQLQCRHSKAIGRYKNSQNNLPDLLASHSNEVRALRKLLRTSQEDERKTSRKLRKVEAELLKAKDALQTLHMLSEDKALAEREELEHKLSVLTEKIEVNDKRIQSLEKQLKLNNSTFSHQLANENKKAVEAAIITKNLKMEINSLHQKIKEKDRQLCGKNIYSNWMPKIPEDKSDPVLHEKRTCVLIFLFLFSYVKLTLIYDWEVYPKIKANVVLSYELKVFCYIEKAESKCVTPGPRNKTFIRLTPPPPKATDNLHHGPLTSDTKPKKGSLCNHRHAGQDYSETAESKVKNSFGLYEPSFGKDTKTRQKDRNSLMKELFGPGSEKMQDYTNHISNHHY